MSNLSNLLEEIKTTRGTNAKKDLLAKSQDDQKRYTAWYERKDSYVSNEFKNWKLVKETKGYK